MANLYEIEDDEVRLNFHRGQWRAFDSEKRFIAVLAGTQGGKTAFGPWWLLNEITRCGPGDYLAVTSTYDLFKLKMLPMLRECFEQVTGLGRYWGGNRIIELADPATREFWANNADDPMWGRIILRSAESDSGLEATTAKAAWLDEAGQPQFHLGTWEAVLRRLSLSLGRALLTTTIYNLGWLKLQVYDRWKRGEPDFDVISFDSTENPVFPAEEAARARATMPRWRYNMMYRGLYDRPAGLIYDSFDEDTCKVPRFAIPDDWPRYLGLDFGGVNTAGVFYAAEPNTGRYFAYREYKAGGRTAKEHVRHLLAGEPMLPRCIGGSHSEGQWRDEFRAAGLPVLEPDIKEVELGIGRVYGLHAQDKIVVFDDLDGYLDQKTSYSRELDANHEPTEKIANKETYHYCFVAGTMVATESGMVPIERISFGTPVLTRAGFRRVVACGETGSRNVSEVVFSDGSSLIGTSDHPVWVADFGFTPIDALRYNDVVANIGGNEWFPKYGNSMGSDIIGIPTPNGHPIASISSGRGSTCIASSGSSTTGQSQLGMRSTTRTKTRGTTRSTISRRSGNVITSRPSTPISSALSGSNSSIASYVLSHWNGITRMRAGSGTVDTPRNSVRTPSFMRGNAGSAGPITILDRSAAGAISVPTHAGLRRVAIPALTTSKPAAGIAATRSSITDSSLGASAPVRVLTVQDVGYATVYNLTVDDAHEYYANGILVSNCDAERYILGWLARVVPESPRLTTFANPLRGYRG